MSMRLAFGASMRCAEIARARAAYRSSRMRRATEEGTRLSALWLLVRRPRTPPPFEFRGESTWLCLALTDAAPDIYPPAFWPYTPSLFPITQTSPSSFRARAVGKKNATEAGQGRAKGQARAKAEADYRPQLNTAGLEI